MVGYATAYTMLPVFSLVLDRDVNEDVALLYPELYKELTKVSCLCLPLLSVSWRLIDSYRIAGPLAILQDVLHLAHDQRLPRCFSSHPHPSIPTKRLPPFAGGAIMIASLVLFESEFLNIVSISFTALVLNELIMVAVEVITWHTLMILSEVFTLGLYVVSIAFLPEYFGPSPSPVSRLPSFAPAPLFLCSWRGALIDLVCVST